MKIQQTATQLQTDASGLSTVIIGALLITVGIVLAVLPFAHLKSQPATPTWLALLGGALVAFGILALWAAKNERITMIKGGETIIDVNKLIGGAKVSQRFPTTDIIAVRLRTTLSSTSTVNDANNSTQPDRQSVLSLLLRDNSLVTVASASKSTGMSINGVSMGGVINRAPLATEAQQIATFLGVALQADDESSFAGAVTSIVSAASQGFNRNIDNQPR